MNITGSEAADYDAVRTDSFRTVNEGVMTAANDETGYVAWKDRAGEARAVTLGSHAIRLVRRSVYRRP